MYLAPRRQGICSGPSFGLTENLLGNGTAIPATTNIQNLLAVMFDSTHFEHGTWVEVHAPCHEQGEPMGVQAIKEITDANTLGADLTA